MKKLPLSLKILALPSLLLLVSCGEQHIHQIVVDPAIEPTCKSHGLTEGSHCSDCGTVITPQEIIEPLGHMIIIDQGGSPTCDVDGKTTGAHCGRCGEVLIQQDVIKSAGHVIVTDAAIEPTCSSPGKTAGAHCSVCGEVLIEPEVVPALGHDYVVDPAVEPTCSTNGYTAGFHCSRCGAVFVEPACIDKKPHTKGRFIDLSAASVDGCYNPGLFECEVCHEEYFDTVTDDDLGMPVVSMDGSFSGISKDNKVSVSFALQNETLDVSGFSTVKLQGASSLYYPKKNYNIQLFKDEACKTKLKTELLPGYGKQSKYTLKANWVDYSASRNIVSGRLYGDVVRSRGKSGTIYGAPNGGAVDGYPVALFENGSFQGLYTLNAKKDPYMFAMTEDSTNREALVMANGSHGSVKLTTPIMDTFESAEFELEYASTEDDEAIGVDWVKDSFNNMINFLMNHDGDEFRSGIANYIDVDAAIDSMLFTWAIHAVDNTAKNILWATYDGSVWIPSVYDMDGSWGLLWNGTILGDHDKQTWLAPNGNLLWERLWANYQEVIKDRWEDLRNGPLSLENIDNKFVDFASSITNTVYSAEATKWKDAPDLALNHITQIVDYADIYLKNMDGALDANVTECDPYSIHFETDEHVTVRCYRSSDYTQKADLTSDALARDGTTGYIVNSDGQVNFEIVVDDGYSLDSITVEGTYKNLKEPADTGKANVYRITKIASDLTVNIHTAAA